MSHHGKEGEEGLGRRAVQVYTYLKDVIDPSTAIDGAHIHVVFGLRGGDFRHDVLTSSGANSAVISGTHFLHRLVNDALDRRRRQMTLRKPTNRRPGGLERLQ